MNLFPNRLYVLATGHCTWIDTETGLPEHEVLDWHSRWAIFGIHSSNWRWVSRFGKRDCGCTFNPLTRCKVLTSMDCSMHGLPGWRDSLAEDWSTDEEWEQEWT